MEYLSWIILAEILYAAAVALYLWWRLPEKKHTRYKNRHVYVELNGLHYHVPREILELYYTIHDPRMDEEESLDKPPNPRVFTCWRIALFLPWLISGVVRPDKGIMRQEES